MRAATRAGFGGGLVVDYPNSRKARKCFLVLWVGGTMRVPPGMMSDEEMAMADKANAAQELPRGLVAEHENPDAAVPGKVKVGGRRGPTAGNNGRPLSKKAAKKARAAEKGSRDWIVHKKELYRKRGKEVCILLTEVAGWHGGLNMRCDSAVASKRCRNQWIVAWKEVLTLSMLSLPLSLPWTSRRTCRTTLATQAGNAKPPSERDDAEESNPDASISSPTTLLYTSRTLFCAKQLLLPLFSAESLCYVGKALPGQGQHELMAMGALITIHGLHWV